PLLFRHRSLTMFETLRQSLNVGVVTTSYPATPAEVSSRARGKPEIDWLNWKDARPAARICPTGAIAYTDTNTHRMARFDLAKCIFCGLCADVDSAIRMTNQSECAARRRDDLVSSGDYSLKADGTHDRLLSQSTVARLNQPGPALPENESLDSLGRQI